MTDSRPLVSVVDDDESVREALPDLLREFGYAACGFSSADELLHADELARTKCLVLDVAMPQMSGPDLFEELQRRGVNIPVIFITAQADPTLRARLFAMGAVDCLTKPFSDDDLRDALTAALHGH